MRRLLPHINKISGGFLVVAGVVLGFYGWWEVQVLLRNDFEANNPFVEASNRVSVRLENWIIDVGGNRFGLATAFAVLAVLLWAFRRSIPRPWLAATSLLVAVGYALSEAIQYQGDLLVLPILRTIAAIPERVGNWFADPARWPVLWAFHKVHHSATTLTPLTVYRTHPMEAVLFSLRGTAVQASVVAVFIFCFGSAVDLFTVLGASVFLFAFNAAGSNLRHSHVRIGYGRRLERWLMSPAQHQIHHSVEERHHDKNFGTVLSLWDWLGGTLYLAEKGEELRYGLTAGETREMNGLAALYLRPALEAGQVVKKGAAAAVDALAHRPESNGQSRRVRYSSSVTDASRIARPAIGGR